MVVAQTIDKEKALDALRDRRARNRSRGLSTLYIFFASFRSAGCIGCNAAISVPKRALQPSMCRDCAELKDLGWLE